MEDPTEILLHLLEELEQVEDEQRQLDLRDVSAVQACAGKIDALRKKIQQLLERHDRH